jgi:hypothetical protein
VSSFEFVGPDPIDHFHLGRIEPGDVVELGADDPGGPWWKATKRRPKRAQNADQAPPGTEHGSDAPDTPEEV